MAGDEILRKEIRGFQKAQAELLRWKLIAIGAVAAAALGLSGPGGERWIVVLSLAPFVAAYCDLLSRTYDLRIALIAFFLREHGGEFAEYEAFLMGESVSKTRWWRLGTAATLISSLGACLLIVIAGLWVLVSSPDRKTAGAVIIVAAVVGAIVVSSIQVWFDRKHRHLTSAPRAG